jgi:hypothetical protein
MTTPLRGVRYIDQQGALTDAGWLMLKALQDTAEAVPPAPTTIIIEPRTSDPASPETGRIWLRTDL